MASYRSSRWMLARRAPIRINRVRQRFTSYPYKRVGGIRKNVSSSLSTSLTIKCICDDELSEQEMDVGSPRPDTAHSATPSPGTSPVHSVPIQKAGEIRKSVSSSLSISLKILCICDLSSSSTRESYVFRLLKFHWGIICITFCPISLGSYMCPAFPISLGSLFMFTLIYIYIFQ